MWRRLRWENIHIYHVSHLTFSVQQGQDATHCHMYSITEGHGNVMNRVPSFWPFLMSKHWQDFPASLRVSNVVSQLKTSLLDMFIITGGGEGSPPLTSNSIIAFVHLLRQRYISYTSHRLVQVVHPWGKRPRMFSTSWLLHTMTGGIWGWGAA